ncbi:glutamine synthetase family protein [Catenulispora pinisilvae]|nr:glutamine synthetase family protein [Catenulispora pinisilvae]
MEHGEHACSYLLASDIDLTPGDGSGLSGWESGYADMLLLPDLEAIYQLPTQPGEALVFANAVDDAAPLAVSPRRILAEQVERLAGRGYNAMIGVEAEYTLIHAPDAEPGPAQPWPSLAPVGRMNADYATRHPRPVAEHLRAVLSAAQQACLPLEAMKTESGPGQIEATFAPTGPVRAADDYTVFKALSRAVAGEQGLDALFMAAPDIDSGNGLHLHVSLHCDGASVMSTQAGDLSQTAKQATAGMLGGLPHLLPLLAPTVNAYRRFRPYSFAPTTWCWGYDNRTCAVRVTGGEHNVHVEIRVAGADANIYLALAAILGTIVEGIDTDASPGKETIGNAYAAHDAVPIATSLTEALADFRRSDLAARIFGSVVADHLARTADQEAAAFREQVTASEIHRAMRA